MASMLCDAIDLYLMSLMLDMNFNADKKAVCSILKSLNKMYYRLLLLKTVRKPQGE
jgi:hypothetical protein